MLALYYLMGWDMGVVEAISVSILIGLSVDYFFHLAEAYSISPAYGRRERTRDALTRMVTSLWLFQLSFSIDSVFVLAVFLHYYYRVLVC
jgi:predicted RND superfamily exporter protein